MATGTHGTAYGIATNSDIYSKVNSNVFSSNSTKCPTALDIKNTKILSVDNNNHTYSNNQLVRYNDIKLISSNFTSKAVSIYSNSHGTTRNVDFSIRLSTWNTVDNGVGHSATLECNVKDSESDHGDIYLKFNLDKLCLDDYIKNSGSKTKNINAKLYFLISKKNTGYARYFYIYCPWFTNDENFHRVKLGSTYLFNSGGYVYSTVYSTPDLLTRLSNSSRKIIVCLSDEKVSTISSGGTSYSVVDDGKLLFASGAN